ncbi:MAG: ABC transporter permease [Nanoarchaeota archaeon]|nr:ABC transporter permease [Nanoarchaeota archaeon]
MIEDLFKLSIVNLRKRKLRSWLTIVGIIIGIGAVVALISLSIGLNREVERQFQLFGSDKLFITPRGMGGFGPRSSSVVLTEKDVDVIKKTKGIDLVSAILWENLPVKYKDEVEFLPVFGIPTDEKTEKLFEEVQGFEINVGRQLKQSDKLKATVGYLLADEDIFENPIKLRSKLEIGDYTFRVVGIYKPIGNRQDDSSVIVPLEELRKIVGDEESVTMIFAKVQKGYDPINVKEDVEKALRDFKNQDEGEETFEVRTSEDLLRLINQLFGTIQVVLIGIGAISLIVGAVGVMNTMYMSVMERTKEIGIMKAIGAKDKDVLLLFLIESGIIGVIGGVFGIVLGIGMAKAVEMFASYSMFIPLKTYVGADLIIGALILSFGMGSIAGILPAKKAAGLNPVDALRYE